jgi:hypothetical protein
MAGSCNRPGQRLEEAAIDAGIARSEHRLAELPKECLELFKPLPRALGTNAVVLVRLYEAKLIDPVTGKPGEWNARVQRCARLYTDQAGAR